MENLSVSVIIAAGGSSTRMKGINKPLAELCGKPVIAYSMLTFQSMDEVGEIIVSARSGDKAAIEAIAEKYGISKFVCCTEGGDTRQQSVINALKCVSKDTSFIAVHDAARPLAKSENISRCIKDAAVFGGASLGVPVKDTIKTVEDGIVTDTPDRRKLYITQTPQIFRKKYYYDGVNFAMEHELDFTDDCQLAEAVGVKVCMTPSDYANIKITTPEDMAIAAALINMEVHQ
ncbi:MAG: 2-C-methyl-D-erythritol 4-phosphate cytidylyltransferase [Huintestinicola sp.]